MLPVLALPPLASLLCVHLVVGVVDGGVEVVVVVADVTGVLTVLLVWFGWYGRRFRVCALKLGFSRGMLLYRPRFEHTEPDLVISTSSAFAACQYGVRSLGAQPSCRLCSVRGC